jgi:hypothetical protein
VKERGEGKIKNEKEEKEVRNESANGVLVQGVHMKRPPRENQAIVKRLVLYTLLLQAIPTRLRRVCNRGVSNAM